MSSGNDSGKPCRRAFTETLLNMAMKDRDIVALTSDARGSVSLEEFAQKLPGQFVEVGIAEQDLVGIGAGMAAYGKKPFVCGPACFLSSRSYEQVRLDAAYSNTNLKMIGVSGGVSYGALGTSHHSLHDIAAMRSIPGLSIVLPCDARQMVLLTEYLTSHVGPVYVRMGRNAVPDVYGDDNAAFTFGKANLLLEGGDITIIAAGEMVRKALDAGLMLSDAGIGARVLDMHTIKPLDTEAVYHAAKQTHGIITVEEHNVLGGLGAAVSEFVVQNCPVSMKILGISDENAVTGNSDEVFGYYGLTASNICSVAMSMLER